MPDSIPVFDGHNDALLRVKEAGRSPASLLERREDGHLDLPRARAGGLVGGLFAVFAPSTNPPEERERPEGYERPLATAPDLPEAQQYAFALAANLFRLERESAGDVTVCRTVQDIRDSMERGSLAAVFHIEGAEAIDPEFNVLEMLYQAGLRSLGPVWSRANSYGTGVPFNYPDSPDIGPGLTDAGKALVRECNRLGILVDLSHLNERGFWDVAEISNRPLVASHSNVHAICPVPRNLTDRQLDAVRASNGLVGLNFATKFLHPQGSADPRLGLDVMVRHLDHLIERLGVTGVALGSDFDGATIPAEIGDVSGLQKLVGTLREHGYDDDVLRRICSENWLDVLDRTWSRSD